MANYNTHFSLEVAELTDVEADWIQGQLDLIEAADETDGPWPFSGDEEFSPGFAAELDRERRQLWIHSDDAGTPGDVVNFLQAFLETHRPAEAIGFEWANTCSRPLLDAFGGGAAYVSATETQFINTGQWLAGWAARA